MFSIFTRRSKSAPELLTSSLLTEQNFYGAFLRDIKRCREELIIESPYMTTSRVNKLLPELKKLIRRGVRVRINTRFPQHHDLLLRTQAYETTKLLKAAGVRVFYYYDYHHRKLALIDNRIIYEGSLNILSQCKSSEIMRRIESEALNAQMRRFLGQKNLSC